MSHHFLVIKVLLVVSCLCAVNASHTLNPIAIGIRSAIAARTPLRVVSNSRRAKSVPAVAVDFSLEEWSDFVDFEDENDSSSRSRRNNKHASTLLVSKTTSAVVAVSTTSATKQVKESTVSRGGGATPALTFFENMLCGAVSRSIAQVATHPANTMKTLLQSNRGSANPITIQTLAKPENLKMLTRGAGAQFILSIPHGAVNFAVLEYVRSRMNNFAMTSPWAAEMSERSPAFGPVLDFMSSAVATVCCSVVSTPQMMIVDNIMAGTYSNFPNALIGLSKDKGIAGFYGGWWPGLAGKIPSYVSFATERRLFVISLAKNYI